MKKLPALSLRITIQPTSIAMRKTFFAAVLAILLGAIPALAQRLYFTTEELPDLVQCLPAPPDSLSAGFGHDVMRYFWGKEQRGDSLRAEITKRDAVWSFEAVIGEFSAPLGLSVSEEATPAIWRLLVNSLATTDQMRLGYRLKIYDAYRPQMGVDHFVRWAADRKDVKMKPYFYPDLKKSVLFKQDYIMEKSGHTRGSTVDLTLFDMATEKELDMGGTFDWFGPESHPDFCGNPDTGVFDARAAAKKHRGLTEQQFRNRLILRQAMLRHGFKPIDSEWWHFTLEDEPFPDTYFTFPVY